MPNVWTSWISQKETKSMNLLSWYANLHEYQL